MIQSDFLLRCAIGIIAGFLGSAIFAFPAAQAQSRGTKYQRSLKDRHRGRFIAWLKMQDAF